MLLFWLFLEFFDFLNNQISFNCRNHENNQDERIANGRCRITKRQNRHPYKEYQHDQTHLPDVHNARGAAVLFADTAKLKSLT